MWDLELDSVVAEARTAFESGKTRGFEWRKSQLEALLRLLQEKEDEMCKVLKQDLGKHRVEAYRDEVGALIKTLANALLNLKKWMSPEPVSLPLIAFPTVAEVVSEPLGVVLVFSSWNFPLGIALEPLIGAIASGNAAVLKPSELAPATSDLLASEVPKYLDSEAIKVIQGGPQVAEQLLELKWDKIFFTGSARVGRIVMTAAAKHLTPVTLELGGKCPAIFDSLKSARDKKVAIERVAGGKWGSCLGQACIGIDYLLVEEKYAATLVELLKEVIKEFFSNSEHLARIVNKHHFQRLCDLLQNQSVADSIVHGGSVNPEKLFIEPTILLDPPLDAEIMTEEIFGPLLPIITLKKIEDSVKFIRARPKPLVIYGFTNDEKLRKRIIEDTSSGCIVFNDALIQYMCDTIPFGGVGQSGFGQYHGKFSFDNFSNRKPVARRSFILELSFRYPPWNAKKFQLIRHILHFDYFGFVLCLLGLKRQNYRFSVECW
ncbi:Aldehyde dehydrogenase [Rhynchospora pubera]|uniref:Aldehyde dehydrogenase n=1 Tax=Rhynchospora pubera TaxID=906938 RepID=A0AAV8H245_9POAL|nr:Aldehyde dehydrogenase [Rhynchospora pubera]